ncbi:hypothetical protein BDA99DRAFT_541716 [Phascolomyces articulosus]|uniref:Uncharacterized protein n=1 Tax=Phascolomyces articulosus TaxID=60185 RepID=A0AAD5P9D9_9FUNG|nr:hypothetical protein BDA99DRAFT_541716 [Phascolomyces articulosus]
MIAKKQSVGYDIISIDTEEVVVQTRGFTVFGYQEGKRGKDLLLIVTLKQGETSGVDTDEELSEVAIVVFWRVSTTFFSISFVPYTSFMIVLERSRINVSIELEYFRKCGNWRFGKLDKSVYFIAASKFCVIALQNLFGPGCFYFTIMFLMIIVYHSIFVGSVYGTFRKKLVFIFKGYYFMNRKKENEYPMDHFGYREEYGYPELISSNRFLEWFRQINNTLFGITYTMEDNILLLWRTDNFLFV